MRKLRQRHCPAAALPLAGKIVVLTGTLPTLSRDEAQALLESAGANAEHYHEVSPEDCWVAQCFVDEAKPLQRWRFRARGRVDRIKRRYSHITICLSDEG